LLRAAASSSASEDRGCRTFYLETFSFQAPGRYRRLGYEAKLDTMVRQLNP